MNLTRKEITAIFKMAKAMALADGKFDQKEGELILMELMRSGIDLTDTINIENEANIMSPTDATVIVYNLDSEEKKYVCAFLGSIMAIDGDIDQKELALWQLTTEICLLPAMNIAEAINYMTNLKK